MPLIYQDAPQFGFDIGTHTVKIVQLRRTARGTAVQGFGECYFPRDAMAEGIVVDPAEVAKAIKPFLRKPTYGKITSRRVIVGLPATKLFTRTLQLPPMSRADLDQAVRYEVEQYVPVPLSDLYTDYEIIRTDPRTTSPQADPKQKPEEHQDVLMMAAPRAIVDSYIKLFDALGLEIGAIEANMTAVVRALLHSGDAGGSTLIMDIGSVSSDLTIYDQFVPLTGSVPVGGEQYTQALMTKLGIKVDQATEIKAKFGIGPSGMHDKVLAALEPDLQKVVKEAKRVIKYYQSRNGSTGKVGSIVISGGGARMPGIDEYFRTAIGLPLKVANPWENLRLKHPTKEYQADAPGFITAAGLALRGLS